MWNFRVDNKVVNKPDFLLTEEDRIKVKNMFKIQSLNNEFSKHQRVVICFQLYFRQGIMRNLKMIHVDFPKFNLERMYIWVHEDETPNEHEGEFSYGVQKIKSLEVMLKVWF